MARPTNPRWRRPPCLISEKNINAPDWIDILHQILWQYASWPCENDHVTKSRNRKLIRVMSSNERLKHNKCVDLSDQCRYFNSIWYRAQIPHCQHTSHNLKIQDGGDRHLEFRKNINNSGLDKNICTIFYVKIHHGHAEMTR